MLQVTVTRLIVTAQEPDGFQYDFFAYEYPNGLIQVSSEAMCDCFFPSRDQIEANGSAEVVEIYDTEEEQQWDLLRLAQALAGSMKELELSIEDSAIRKGWDLIKDMRTR